jgi:hypothetical protein
MRIKTCALIKQCAGLLFSIPVYLLKSLHGEYFVGQTETLLVGNGTNA